MTDRVDEFRYETWELDEMVSAIEPQQLFLLNRYFAASRTFETPTIEWDIVERGQRLAPFVSPYVPGRPIRSQGHMTATLKPAYVKPLKTLTPADGYIRIPGERYGGELTPRQRIDRALAQQLALHENMLDNRLEWMGASALVNGNITIAGDDYPSVVVDFGHHADLTVSVADPNQWDDATGAPLDDIEAHAMVVRDKSYGSVVDELVMDGKAWGFFRTRMAGNVNFAVDQRLGSSQIESGPRNSKTAERVGRLAGRFDIWVYDGFYENDEGAAVKYLPDYTVLLMAGIEGKRYFGAIQDLDNGMVAQRMFHKTKTEWDPSGVTLLSQSAPALAPRRRNAWGKLIVKS